LQPLQSLQYQIGEIGEIAIFTILFQFDFWGFWWIAPCNPNPDWNPNLGWDCNLLQKGAIQSQWIASHHLKN